VVTGEFEIVTVSVRVAETVEKMPLRETVEFANSVPVPANADSVFVTVMVLSSPETSLVIVTVFAGRVEITVVAGGAIVSVIVFVPILVVSVAVVVSVRVMVLSTFIVSKTVINRSMSRSSDVTVAVVVSVVTPPLELFTIVLVEVMVAVSVK
jgi:hypothetical protein